MPMGEYEGIVRTGIDSGHKGKTYTVHIGSREDALSYILQFKNNLLNEGNTLLEEKSFVHHPASSLQKKTKPNISESSAPNTSQMASNGSPSSQAGHSKAEM